MNWIGPLAALSAFLSIWFGHVAVRKVEAGSARLWVPTALFALLGLSAEAIALTVSSRPLSTVFGIVGVTLLFDALEFRRQENRVRKGHAPANPANPRHARILADWPTATTDHPLEHEPLGQAVAGDEAPTPPDPMGNRA